MSAALKRRFNFETVFPIADLEAELSLVKEECERLLAESGVPLAPNEDVLRVLVTAFRELREGTGTLGPTTGTMSTAEAVTVGHAAGVRAWYLRRAPGNAADIVECLAGTAAKGDDEDLSRIVSYLEGRATRHPGAEWRALHDARHVLAR
jgi:hypothetical protein